MRAFALIIILIISPIPAFALSPNEPMSEESNCPCPYDRDSAGNLCGKQSAWCKQGGNSPACDVSKIPNETIQYCNPGSETNYSSIIANCSCPRDLDSAGNLCDKRSDWCRLGEDAPACELDKMTYEEIKGCN